MGQLSLGITEPARGRYSQTRKRFRELSTWYHKMLRNGVFIIVHYLLLVSLWLTCLKANKKVPNDLNDFNFLLYSSSLSYTLTSYFGLAFAAHPIDFVGAHFNSFWPALGH